MNARRLHMEFGPGFVPKYGFWCPTTALNLALTYNSSNWSECAHDCIKITRWLRLRDIVDNNKGK